MFEQNIDISPSLSVLILMFQCFKLTAVNLGSDPPSGAKYWQHPVLCLWWSDSRDDTCYMLPASHKTCSVFTLNTSDSILITMSQLSHETMSQHLIKQWLVNKLHTWSLTILPFTMSHLWQHVTSVHHAMWHVGQDHSCLIWTFHHSFNIKSASQRCLHARLIS